MSFFIFAFAGAIVFISMALANHPSGHYPNFTQYHYDQNYGRSSMSARDERAGQSTALMYAIIFVAVILMVMMTMNG